jgi:hypothetical protein
VTSVGLRPLAGPPSLFAAVQPSWRGRTGTGVQGDDRFVFGHCASRGKWRRTSYLKL